MSCRGDDAALEAGEGRIPRIRREAMSGEGRMALIWRQAGEGRSAQGEGRKRRRRMGEQGQRAERRRSGPGRRVWEKKGLASEKHGVGDAYEKIESHVVSPIVS